MSIKYNYDTILIEVMNICNVFNYSKKNNIEVFNQYISDNKIDIKIIENYITFFEDLLVEYQIKDYDLQYNEATVDGNGRLIPNRPYDTIITFDFVETIERLDGSDLIFLDEYQYKEIVLHFQQALVNGMKFQLKYMLENLNQINKIFNN